MNLSEIIDRGARAFADKPALIHDGGRIAYGRLQAAVARVAVRLREHGIRRGDRVAVYMPNRPEWVAAYYGIVRAGAVAVCVGAAYRRQEVQHLLEVAQADLVITCEELLARAEPPGADPARPRAVLAWERDDGLAAALAPGAPPPEAFPPVDCGFGDPCAILFTGGTTGTPKGAVLTHGNILYTAQNVCYHERAAAGDVALCFLPLNHVFGGNHILNATLYGCGTLVLQPGFDMDRALAAVRAEKVSRFYSVPTVFIRLLNAPDSPRHLASVTYCFSAAASMAADIVRRWRERFGRVIHEAYGMTETASLVTFNHMYRHKAGSVGTPAGVVEVRIVDPEDRPLPAGEAGEILIRGPNVMAGYFNQPAETARALRGGWLHSGDIGRIDSEGYLFIVDRIKDLVITGGLNVYPSEVEAVLYTHPGVEECCVVGMPHPEYGEAVTAFVKRREAAACREGELIDYCKQHLASYKAPKSVRFVAELPKSPAGKILKREVRHLPAAGPETERGKP